MAAAVKPWAWRGSARAIAQRSTGGKDAEGVPVSRRCGEFDERVQAFLTRPSEGEWPYLWLDATYVKARRGNRIVAVAVIVAVGVNTDGRREVLGMTIGRSEAEPFWVAFLRSLTRRGLRGVPPRTIAGHPAAPMLASPRGAARCVRYFIPGASKHLPRELALSGSWSRYPAPT